MSEGAAWAGAGCKFFSCCQAGQTPVMNRCLSIPALVLSVIMSASCGDKESRGDGSQPMRQTGESQRAPVSSKPEGMVKSRPLVARSEQKGASLFQRLSPDETGVTFQNRIDVSHPLKRLYHSGFVCGGVAIGDVTGDGLPDLFFASGPGKNRLYRQEGGSFKFGDITRNAGVEGEDAWATGAALADVDNDGDLDLYVCNYDSPNALYLNDGSGKFREAAEEFGLAQVDACLVPSFCDYDRDGDLDVFLLTNRYYRKGGRPVEPPFEEVAGGRPRVKPEFRKYYGLKENGPGSYGMDEVGRPDLLLRNDGGKFTDVSNESGIRVDGHGLSATWWDYDHDGLMDLYVCNDFADPDNLFRNNGDGTFTDTITSVVNYTPWFSMGADAGDINNDGQLDFVALDMAATTHYKSKMAMGEMGAMRYVIEKAMPRQVMRNCLYVSVGMGRYIECASLSGISSSDWSWAAKLADFDNDGKVDLFISNGMARDFNNSDITFTPADQIGKSEWDHYENTPTKPEQNLSFRNKGDYKFEDTSKEWGLDHVGMSYGSAYGDLDGDGDLDLVTVNLEEPVSIYRNGSQKGNCITVSLRGVRSNSSGIGALVTVEAGDVKHVRQLVPMSGYLSSNEPIIHFGLGEAERVDRVNVRWPDGREQEYRGLEVNHHHEITEAGEELPVYKRREAEPLFLPEERLRGIVHKEKVFEDFSRQPLLPNKLSQLGPGVAVADVNGDGSEDFYIATARGQSGAIFLNDGKGNFRLGTTSPFDMDEDTEGMGVLFFDADSDGDQDLYVASGSYEYDPGSLLTLDRLYLNDGSGNFVKAPPGSLPESRDNSSCVVAADFDCDGDLDLFVGGRVISGDYPVAATSHLLLNESSDGEVRFVKAPAAVAPGLEQTGMVTGALWSDADGDGWVDLLLSQEWGPVKLFRNESGKLVDVTSLSGLQKYTGWWNSIAGGDIDHDGDIDYVVGNAGLNTKYHADAGHPVMLYYGEYGDEGKKRLVEAKYEDDIIVPARGKSCSTKAMPHLGKKFGTFHQFASATLPQIYTQECLTESLKLEATTLESGVFINDGKGKFSFHPLPNIAQSSSIFGVSLVDVNSDGRLDLYAVQNFSNPQFETPPFRGGLSVLLLGDGEGGFDAVPHSESGLVVPGDGRGLACTDFNRDGRPDFLIGINDGELRAFTNRPGLAGRSLRLEGRVGNSHAAGARIILFTGTGQRVTEVYQGSGYLSQSTPVIFLDPEVTRVEVTWPGPGKRTSALDLDEGSREIVLTMPQ